MLRRLVVIAFGFVIAAGAGMVFLPIAALFDASTREAGLAVMIDGIFGMMDGDIEANASAALALGLFLWAAGLAVCVAPLGFVALIGEAAGVRAYAWYAGGSGILAAAAPWIARAARGSARAGEMNAAEARFALLFFLAGALTGSIYWLIAVRGAGREARRDHN
ncbi:hypothetical protein [Methylosinus sp. Sm6]|uniref:hypothetical protein n=1 Tax=Methylosinus sp. Sm6 TaxID=2866948 RepID=UPI001C98EC7E|nr:hypothetical protein [Methylosinus sp. Sm6]MBY6240982.1 hypothetical protein [Methylosinus sp. Sm6]